MKIAKRFKKYEFFAISENEDNNIELTEELILKKTEKTFTLSE